VAGDKEQRGHEEGLQEGLIKAEEHHCRQARDDVLRVVPVAEGAVGIRGVHAQHQDDHDPTDVVDEGEA